MSAAAPNSDSVALDELLRAVFERVFAGDDGQACHVTTYVFAELPDRQIAARRVFSQGHQHDVVHVCA